MHFLITGLLGIFLGSFVIAGWHLHSIRIVQMVPNGIPLQYNTAICFILTGVLYTLIHFNGFKRDVKILTSFIFVICLLTIAEYILQINLYIDQLFIEPFDVAGVSIPGRMAPNTALCFCLFSFVLLFYTTSLNLTYARTLLSSACVILAISTTALIGHIFDVAMAYGWGGKLGMSLQSSVGIIILASGLFIEGFRRILNSPREDFVSIPFAIILYGIIVGGSFWYSLNIKEQESLHSIAYRTSLLIKSQIETALAPNIKSLQRLASLEDTFSLHEELATVKKKYFSTTEELKALIIHDGRGKIATYLNLDPKNSAPSPTELAFLSAQIEINLHQREFTKVSLLPSNSKSRELLLSNHWSNREDYYLSLIVDVRVLLDNILNKIDPDIALTLTHAGITFFQTKFKEAKKSETYFEYTIFFYGLPVYLSFNLSPAFILEHRSYAPEFISLLFFCFSLLVSISYYNHRLIIVRAQKKLKVAQEMQQTFAASGCAMFVVNREGAIRLYNSMGQIFFGHMDEDLVGKKIESIIPGLFCDLNLFLQENFGQKPSENTRYIRMQGIHKNNNTFPIEVYYNLSNIDGEDAAIVSVIDVTARESAIERFQLAAEGAGVGIWDWIDVQNNNEYWSPVFYNLIGYSPDELDCSHENFIRLIHPMEREIAVAAFQNHLQGKGELNIECRLKTKDKIYRWFLITGKASFDPLGQAKRVVGSIQDIHERVSYEKELERSNKELDSFISTASHDLKSPLQAIHSLVKWLGNDCENLNSRAKERLDNMMSRLGIMEKLVDDLLLYSRTSNKIYEIEDTDTFSLICSISKEIAKPASYRFEIDERLPAIKTFKTPLYIIFKNLIENSIKHRNNDYGCTRISVSNGEKYYQFEIEDNGPGIPIEAHEKVFEIFRTLTPEGKGSGVGLTIVRKTLIRYGGWVKIDPKYRDGAKFVFTWPKDCSANIDTTN